MLSKSNSRPTRKLADRILLCLAGVLGSLLIRILIGSLRMTIENGEPIRGMRSRGQKVIYAFWHSQILINAYVLRNMLIHPIISEHRDGEIIARIIEPLGFPSVRGSTTRGGVKVILNILTRLNNRYDLAITPDGPLGPRWKVQQGVIYIAQKTGLPIVPLANGSDRYWEFNSWDKFRIPKPFSRSMVIYGDPITIPRDLGRDEYQDKMKDLEEKLISLSMELYKRLGVPAPKD